MLNKRGVSLVELVFAILMSLMMVFPVGMLLSGSGNQLSNTKDSINRTIRMLMTVERFFSEYGSITSRQETKSDEIQVEVTRENGIKNTLKFSSRFDQKNDSEDRKKKNEITFERTISVPEYGLICDYDFN